MTGSDKKQQGEKLNNRFKPFSATFLIVAVCFILCISMINLASAGILTSFDNSISPIKFDKETKLNIGDKQLNYNKIWEDYKPIKVENFWGLGSTIFEGAITKHDYTCGEDCETDMTLCIDKPGILVNDIRFKTLQKDNSWIEQDVRNYKLSYQGEIQDYKTVYRQYSY